MAALILYVASTLFDLYNFVNIFSYTGYNIQETCKCFKEKKRLQLFQYYLREYHENYKQKYIKHNYNKLNSGMKSAINCEFLNNMGTYSIKMDDKCLIANDVDKISLSCEAIDENSVISANEYFENIDGNSSFDIVDFNSIEVLTACKHKGSLAVDYDEELVYQNPHLIHLREGVSFVVTGITKKYCERFSINFIVENRNRDIALHISPRIPQNYVVRNSRIRKVWGKEEVASQLPFNLKRGEKFSIQILFTDNCFMVGINGHHFCQYVHRIPYTDITTLEVKGDVENDITVERMRVDHYPYRLPDSEPLEIATFRQSVQDQDSEDEVDVIKVPRQWRRISLPTRVTLVLVNNDDNELQLPFWGTFPIDSFEYGQSIKIDGRVKLLPVSFTINIQTGTNIWPHPIVALHLNARFSKQHSGAIGRTTMIRNAWKDGAWGQEERSDIETEFRPGKSFNLCIVHGVNAFEIYVNHRFLTFFKYRTNTQLVNAIYIIGDIKLWNVTLDNSVSFERIKPLKRPRGTVLFKQPPKD